MENIFRGIVHEWSVEKISEFLENNDFDFNSLNSENKTIIEFLIEDSRNRSRALNVLTTLLNHGADLLKLTTQGNTLLSTIMEYCLGEFSINFHSMNSENT